MPDVEEVFHLVTQEVRPDPGALDRQSRRQRRRNNRRKAGVYALVAALAVGTVIVAAGVATRQSDLGPAQTPTPHVGSGAASLAPAIVGTDGVIRRTFGFLPSDAWNVTVSPDGMKIAYVTGSIDVGACGACTPGPRLVVVRTDGTGSHYVTLHAPTSPAIVQMPAWSPDGTKLAFAGITNGYGEIYVVGANGSNPQRLTLDNKQNEFPSWSPDGKTIVYDSRGTTAADDSGLSPTQEIWSIPADGSRPPTRLTRNDTPDQAPSFAPDGTIVFSHDGTLATMNSDGTNLHPLAGSPAGSSPRLSPDGTTVAFLTFAGGRSTFSDPVDAGPRSLPLGEVVLVDVTSGALTDLGVQVPTSRNAVSWMPSGDALLVERSG